MRELRELRRERLQLIVTEHQSRQPVELPQLWRHLLQSVATQVQVGQPAKEGRGGGGGGGGERRCAMIRCWQLVTGTVHIIYNVYQEIFHVISREKDANQINVSF